MKYISYTKSAKIVVHTKVENLLLGNNLVSEPHEGKTITFEELINEPLLLFQSITEGVPSHFFAHLVKEFPFSDEEWAQQLQVSSKSLQRYLASPEYIFRPIHSEKIMSIAEVFFLGLQVFGSKEACYNWLKHDSLAFGYLSPIQVMRNSYGKDLVLAELHNIDHGIFA